jgi:hypothetical protein
MHLNLKFSFNSIGYMRHVSLFFRKSYHHLRKKMKKNLIIAHPSKKSVFILFYRYYYAVKNELHKEIPKRWGINDSFNLIYLTRKMKIMNKNQFRILFIFQIDITIKLKSN